MGAEICAQHAREEARKATREAHAWSLRMERLWWACAALDAHSSPWVTVI
jgi:hypothetical protein